jgi:hypothetical protein
VLGMPRQPSRVHEETVPEELLASIPTVPAARADELTTFAIESEESVSLSGGEPPPAVHMPGTIGAAISQQLRYDLGEALARELDRAAETFAGQISDLETRLQQAEAALMATHQELANEREARENAEKRLSMFKELALK